MSKPIITIAFDSLDQRNIYWEWLKGKVDKTFKEDTQYDDYTYTIEYDDNDVDYKITITEDLK